MRPHEPLYLEAGLYLREGAGDLLRLWLDRPLIDPALALWREIVDRYADRFEDGGRALRAAPIEVPDCDPSAIIEGFAALAEQLEKPAKLRKLSARCFGDDSKFLEGREPLLNHLFGKRSRFSEVP